MILFLDNDLNVVAHHSDEQSFLTIEEHYPSATSRIIVPNNASIIRDEETMIQTYSIPIPEDKLIALELRLKEVDTLMTAGENVNFTYNGNEYYASAFIQNTYSRCATMAVDATITWKTADKDVDGVSNIMVDFTPAEFVVFGDAYYDDKEAIWQTGEVHKMALKALYVDGAQTAEDIMNYSITM